MVAPATTCEWSALSASWPPVRFFYSHEQLLSCGVGGDGGPDGTPPPPRAMNPPRPVVGCRNSPERKGRKLGARRSLRCAAADPTPTNRHSGRRTSTSVPLWRPKKLAAAGAVVVVPPSSPVVCDAFRSSCVLPTSAPSSVVSCFISPLPACPTDLLSCLSVEVSSPGPSLAYRNL